MAAVAVDERLGARMAERRDQHGLSVEAAAAQARVGDRTWAACEEFGARACTAVTLRRILDWLAA